MFKLGKSRHHTSKLVFRLQFQATQVANPGTKLMLSLIPEDVGKPTVRLRKSLVGEDGNCTWEDPVYETVKLTRDTKLGKIQDKFYHFVVATGSSKKGFVGEILFNFADFVEAVAPVTVWQPINASNSDAAIHVTIQNMQGGDDPRVIEGATVESPSQHRRLKSQLSMSTTDRNSDHDSVGEDYWNTILFRDDEKSGTSFDEQASFNPVSNQTPPLDPRRNSSSNSRQDTAMYLETSSSEPSPNWNSLSQRKMSYNARENGHREDKATRKRETLSSDASPEHNEKEILSFERQVEVMELELQTLRRQVVKETKRGQELSRQISSLKDEKEVLRAENEKYRSRKSEKGRGGEFLSEKETDDEDSKDRLGEVEDELAHVKSINKMLRRQLGKTQDSNSELILVVRDLEERLDKKEKKMGQLSIQFRKSKQSEDFQIENRDFHYKSDLEENQGVAKDLIPNNSHDQEVKLLKEKIVDLEDELENEMEEKKQLQEKISQVLRDYEFSKQKNFDISTKYEDARQQVIEKENQCNCLLLAIEELESEITKMESVMEKQGEEFSDSSDAVHRLQTQIKNLENELESKSREYEDNITEILNAKTDQDQRVILAEEELRKVKMNHAAAAQRVQEEFQNLSTELAVKFDENEKLTIQAQTEADELHLQVKTLEEQLTIANEDILLMKDDYDIEVEKLSEQLTEKDKQLEQLLVKLTEECKVIESVKQKHEFKSNTLSKENEALRVEMERLTEENYHLSKQSEETESIRAELEVMKTSMRKTKMLLEVADKEKEELENKYASARMEGEESLEELKSFRSSYEKKKAMIEIFQSELQQLRAQSEELKNHLSEEKLQKENLKKQVVKQNEELQKKDRQIAEMEEKYQNNKEGNVSKDKVKQNKITRKVQAEGIPSQNGTVRGSWKSRKEAEKNVKVRDPQSDSEGEVARLISEVAEMKVKNTSIESELKEMQEKYSEVSLRFAEVEGERQQLVMTVRNLRNAQKK